MSLKQEIKQQIPFVSLSQELFLNLLRTTDAAEREVQRIIKPWGITSTQYNVLRILRGSEPDGLTCSSIGARMITAEPDVTRLVARLKIMKLARQQRDKQDRRVVWTRISAEGLKLLKQIDPEIERFPYEVFTRLSEDEKIEMIRLLEKARTKEPAPVTCDGKHEKGT